MTVTSSEVYIMGINQLAINMSHYQFVIYKY